MIGFFDEAILSAYSRPFYHSLAHQAKGIGLRLILLLTLITLLFLSPWKIYMAISGMVGQIPNVVTTLPAITYKDNKLSIDKPVPYHLKLGIAPSDVEIMIDTDYKINDVDSLTRYMRQNQIAALFTADKLVLLKRADQGEMDIRDLGTFSSLLNMTHQDWQKFSDTMTKWGTVSILSSMFIMMFIVVFFANLVATFFTAMLVKIISLIAQVDIEFNGAMRLSAAFRIPVAVITFVTAFVGLTQVSGIVSWVAWLAYLSFAVFSSQENKNSIAG